MKSNIIGTFLNHTFKDKSLVGSSFHTRETHTRLESQDKEFRTWSSELVVSNAELNNTLKARAKFSFLTSA